MRARATAEGEGWRLPPNPIPADTPEVDQAWANPRRVPQPVRPSYERAQAEGWGHDEIDATHNPHITVPEVLTRLLGRIAAKR